MTSGTDESTGALLERAQSGDEQALGDLLERHLPAVRAYVHSSLRPHLRAVAETEDYVGDTVVEFLRHAPRFRISDGKHFRALLCKVALNVIRGKHDWFTAKRRDMARERRLSPDSVVNLDPPDPSAERPTRILQERDRRAVFDLALELLSPADREIILLHDTEGLSFAEIADALNVGEAAARKRLQRALPRLADAVRRIVNGRVTELF